MVEKTLGKIRAEKAHDNLLAIGYEGSERSTRRAVAQVRAAYRLGHVRVHRPWITEPGMWLQYYFGDGPVIEGKKTVWFVAWLAWCRFPIVIALRDRTAALNRTFRILDTVSPLFEEGGDTVLRPPHHHSASPQLMLDTGAKCETTLNVLPDKVFCGLGISG